MEEERLKDKIDSINEKLDEVLKGKTKIKQFKLPARGKVSKSKVKNNWITICKVNENRGVNFTRQKIENQTVVIDDVPRLATGEDILSYKGKPMIILPSWSVKPFSPSEHFKKSLEDGSNTKGYALLLARMKAGAIEMKKKMNLWLIIGLLVLAGIVLYVVLKK